jgi:hypothetical protein
MNDRQNRRRYSIGVLASAGFFVAINLLHFSRPVTCADCFFPYGVPFTIYHEGGFVGGAGFVWAGIAADLFVTLVFGIVVGWIWRKFSELRSSKV